MLSINNCVNRSPENFPIDQARHESLLFSGSMRRFAKQAIVLLAAFLGAVNSGLCFAKVSRRNLYRIISAPKSWIKSSALTNPRLNRNGAFALFISIATRAATPVKRWHHTFSRRLKANSRSRRRIKLLYCGIWTLKTRKIERLFRRSILALPL